MNKFFSHIYTYLLNIIIFVLLIAFGLIFNLYWIDSKTPKDNLSKDYIPFLFKNDTEDDFNSISSLINEIKSKNQSFILTKNTDYGYSWIMNYNQNIPFKITNGRCFNNDDYLNKKNVALVSSKNVDSLYKIDNKKYIDINNTPFEVVGIFQYEENKIYPNSEIFLSMSSPSFINSINGKYNLDCNKNTMDIFESINCLYKVKKLKSCVEMNWFERINLIVDAQSFSIKIYLSILLVIVILQTLNCFFFIKEKKNESYVRIICGATIKDLIIKYLYEYLTILILTNVLIIFIVSFFKLSFSTMIFCMSINVIFSSITMIIIMNISLKTNIIELR
ncbi:ABC transporter permease [Longibaculum muris]|uniref:ABC transporter permease n=1 Tax=Longibaculum muris TaxID=1796628 RepID=UPI0022E04151|nr:ABC transporter permease [Longibaculum muris]